MMINDPNQPIPWDHTFIENRFNISTDSTEQSPDGGSWQILHESELVLRHDPISGHRQLAYPIAEDDEIDQEDCTWENNGIESEYRETLRPGDPRPYLLVTTTSLANHELFTDLILHLLVSGTESPEAIIQRLQVLQAWWGSPMPILSDEAAAGLFGELYFLSRCTEDTWGNRISAWDGPNIALNDFNWADDLGLHVEVKTTRGFVEPLIHTISSLAQLSVQENHHLAIFSMSARPDPGGDVSLNGLVGEIEQHIENSPLVHQEFIDKLSESGWSPNSPEFRYIVDEDLIRMYRVDDNFPRLIADDMDEGNVLGAVDNRIFVRTYRITMEDLGESLLPITSGTPEEILEHLQ